MKTFNKIALVSAIAAAPFMAQADLTPMDDALMGDTTGQAGVTIEIDIAAAGVKIGEVEYTDTQVGADTDGGSVLLQNIHITNADVTQTIDVDGDGSLKLGISAIDNLTVDIGNVGGATPGASAVALKATSGATTEVVNDVHLVMDMASSTTTLVNLAETGNAAKYGVTQSFDNGVDPSSSAAAGSLAIQANASININDMDVGVFGYTQAQSQVAAVGQTAVVAAKATLDGAAAGTVTYTNGVAVSDDAADDAAVATYNGVHTAATNQIAGGSAVQLNDVKFYGTGGVNSFATVNQTIWAKGGTKAQGGGVYIAMGQIQGTLEVGGIVLGGESIGSVKVSGIDLSGMTQRIYGH